MHPKFELCSKDETDELLKKYNLKSLYQLPQFTRDDAIVKYYNYKPGSVIKITRVSKTSIKYNFYRCVK